MFLVIILGIVQLLWYAFIVVLLVGGFVFMHSLLEAQHIDEDGNRIASPGLTAVTFPEVNVVIAEDQPQYKPLPAYVNYPTSEREVVTCWKLTRLERFKLLCTGRLWLLISTFGHPLQPLYLTIHKRDVLVDSNEVSQPNPDEPTR